MRGLQDKIETLLLSTGRKGMPELVVEMDKMGFFEAPCSTQYHLAKPGGLAEHSLNVCVIAEKLAALLYPEVDIHTVRIVSLLHDLGKAGQYGKPGYIPNMLKGKATKANPDPQPYQSEKKPYVANPSLLCIDHEIRSIVIAQQYIALTEEEQQAILWHNGMYGCFKYELQGKETPLYLILHMADMWASRVIEAGKGDEDDGSRED